jgi:hypothetical protein
MLKKRISAGDASRIASSGRLNRHEFNLLFAESQHYGACGCSRNADKGSEGWLANRGFAGPDKSESGLVEIG